MALNKSQTSLGVKVILIVLIVAFVASFIPFVSGAFTGNNSGTATNGTTDSIDQQFQPTVASLTSVLQSDPESYTVLVSLGNSYFDWAAQKQQASQTSTSAAGADQPLWVAAKDAYRRALAVKTGEAPVMVDYAITAFYTGETNEAIKAAEAVVKTNPEFAPAHFNLGLFYKALGQNAKAITAFQTYLKLDPQGQQGDTAFAQSQLDELKGASSATTTP